MNVLEWGSFSIIANEQSKAKNNTSHIIYLSIENLITEVASEEKQLRVQSGSQFYFFSVYSSALYEL